MQNACFQHISSPQYFDSREAHMNFCSRNEAFHCTVVTPELYICWATLAELIWLCSTWFYWSMPLCNGAVVFERDVDGTCGQEGALLCWSAVAALSQYLFYPFTLSYCYWNFSQVSVRHLCCFFSVCHWRPSSKESNIRMTFEMYYFY